MSRQKLLIFAIVGIALSLFFHYDLGRFLDLSYLHARHAALAAQFDANPLPTMIGYFVLYVAVAALSLPGAAVMTLAGGAIFGLAAGTALVSFASTLGATLAFLVARYLLRDSLERRFTRRLGEINHGISRDGAFYLFTLRLVPLFPFFVINLLMGLTRMRVGVFYLVSQVGMLPGTLVYVNAGTQLGQVESLRGIVSPPLLASFALLGVFPLIARAFVGRLQRRRVYAPWKAARPRRFDRNLIVIGAGAAGLVSSYIAAATRARVTLVERDRMGGDCLNTGCVPSKALLKAAQVMRDVREAHRYGLADAHATVDFAAVMARVRDVVRAIEPHDSVARYEALGVECVSGSARIVDPWRVVIERNGQAPLELTTRAIVIATGAAPAVPPLPGLAEAGYLTSETLWGLRELPPRLVVLGGGPIGCEMAQCFARLGSAVTLVQDEPQLLPREDADAAAAVAKALQAEGVAVLTGHRAQRCEQRDGAWHLVTATRAGERTLPFDRLLCATGRAARLEGYGLEELGIPAARTIETNACLQTRYPNILAAGDVAGPYQLTHAAAHQAWYATINALFGRLRRFKADYSVLPWTTFTDPEIARVGLNERDAAASDIPCEVTRYDLAELDRGITDGNAEGFVKVLTVPGKDRILGVTIVGPHAGELLAEFVLAMRHGLGLGKILGTVHSYPTLAEANKYAAGAWRRAHPPARVLAWLERFHAWQRG